MAFYSHKLSPAETRSTTREHECLAVKECLAEWRHYLLGAPFSVGSDHQSLQWLSTQNVTTLSGRLLRWVEFFSLFDFVQEYLPGQENVIPDYLSRPPVEVLLATETGVHEQLDLLALVFLLRDGGQEATPGQLPVWPLLVESRVAFGCVEWESEQFQGVMRARCYQFKLPKRRFHGVNPQVYK